MAVIAGYSTLQTAVTDYLGRSDLSTFVPNFIQNFEERFFRHPKNWGRWMETALSVSISGGVAAVPSAFLGLKVAYISGQLTPPLKYISLDQLYSRYPRSDTTGLPIFMARNGSNFEFGPTAGDGYTLAGTYHAKQTLLRNFSSDAAANWLILNAPDLLLYGSLMEAEPFLIDDNRLPLWHAKYTEAVDAYRAENAREQHFAPMVVVT